jgi:hypothetical protein
MSNSLTNRSAVAVRRIGHPAHRFSVPLWGYMKSTVYEREVDTRDELLQRIFDAKRCVNDTAAPRKVTLSVVERVRMCIQAEGGHLEHLLNLIVQPFFQTVL